ncbi:MAG: hypothetical protein GY801_39405 [bacterium]|nr:hypothetical protein [bacterium]
MEEWSNFIKDRTRNNWSSTHPVTFGQPGCQNAATPRLSSEASHRVLMTFWGSYSGDDPTL